jgi:nucleoside 2-deoxyribosyltransferase
MKMKERLIKMISVLLLAASVFGFASCSTDVTVETAETAESAPVIPIPETDGFTGNKVYFAAPLFSEAEREYNLYLTEILESYGYEVFLPQRDGFLATELEGLSEEEKIATIFEKDKEEVLKADIVFAVLDGRVPDEGVCIELGIAYANGKRCYGFKSDARSVELDMDLNPMIVGCLTYLFYDVNGDDLIVELEEYLETNPL